MTTLNDTFTAYESAQSAATRAYIDYAFGKVSEGEVHRLQRVAAAARAAHVAAMGEGR